MSLKTGGDVEVGRGSGDTWMLEGCGYARGGLWGRASFPDRVCALRIASVPQVLRLFGMHIFFAFHCMGMGAFAFSHASLSLSCISLALFSHQIPPDLSLSVFLCAICGAVLACLYLSFGQSLWLQGMAFAGLSGSLGMRWDGMRAM